MRVLLISPLGLAVTSSMRYGGIERLVWEFARELDKQGHDVTVQCVKGSVFPPKVKLLECNGGGIYDQELNAWRIHSNLYRQFDIIHDFSHQHFATRNAPQYLRSVSAFWHSPALAKYIKAPYNIVAPSVWAAKEYKRVYHQEARYQEIIIIDPEKYHTGGKRGDRFLTIGRMAEEKGNLNAAKICKELGLSLDICGGRGLEKTDQDPLTEYEQAVMNLCDGKQIVFRGEVTDEEKIELMQACRALLYITDHMEPTSHKIQECIACGAPVIAPQLGALSEVVIHNVNGYLCNDWQEYKDAIANLDKLKPTACYDSFLKKYNPTAVTSDYIKLYERVAGGLRW